MSPEDWEAWWAARDGGWDLVVRRGAPASDLWLVSEMERVGVFGDDPAEEVKPPEWWGCFWD